MAFGPTPSRPGLSTLHYTPILAGWLACLLACLQLAPSLTYVCECCHVASFGKAANRAFPLSLSLLARSKARQGLGTTSFDPAGRPDRYDSGSPPFPSFLPLERSKPEQEKVERERRKDSQLAPLSLSLSRSSRPSLPPFLEFLPRLSQVKSVGRSQSVSQSVSRSRVSRRIHQLKN